jgi:hypothetical protein
MIKSFTEPRKDNLLPVSCLLCSSDEKYGSATFRSRQYASGKIQCIKRPKLEIFVAGIFTHIRPVWIGDLGTRPKNSKSLCLGPYITIFFPGIFVVALSATAAKKIFRAKSKKKLF